MAIDAVIRFFDLRGVVALLIKSDGKLQDLLGAVLNTISTPLASILDDVNHSPRDLNLI